MIIKKLLILFVFISLSVFAQNQSSDWNKQDYPSLADKLLNLKSKNPDEALKLADFLIKKFPDRDLPYVTAGNIYILKNDFQKAEKYFNDGIKNCVEDTDLYLKLAHFYKRSNTDKLDQLIEKFKNEEKDHDDYNSLLAKLYIIADKKGEAGKIYSEQIEKGNQNFFGIKSSFDILKKEGKNEEAAQTILKNIYSSQVSNDERIKLFEDLLTVISKNNSKDIPDINKIFGDIILEMNDYVKSKELIQKTSFGLAQTGLEKEYLDNLLTLKDVKDYYWIYIQSLQYLGNPQKAGELIAEYNGENPKLLEEKARLLFQIGSDKDKEESISLWKKLAEKYPNDIKIQITYAQFLNKYGAKKDSQNILDKIPAEKLTDTLEILYYVLSFDNLSSFKEYKRIIETWEKSSKKLLFSHLDVFKNAIFRNIPQTPDHKEFVKILDEKINSNKNPAKGLFLLRVYISEELRDMKAYFNFANKYLSSFETLDPDITYIFVKKAINDSIVRTEEGAKIKYIIKDKDILDFAEKYILKLIEKTPQISDNYIDLTIIYKAKGNEEKALETIKNISAKQDDKPEALHLVAYSFAKADYPELALPYYEKAIAKSPDTISFKINYAGCLIRLKQYKKAIDIYTEVLTSKYTAKNWDMDFIFKQVQFCYDKLQTPYEIKNYINKYKTNETVIKLAPDEYYIAGSRALETVGYKKEAIKLLEEFILKYPKKDQINDCYFKIAEIYISEKNFKKAKQTFEKCRNAFAHDIIKTIDSTYNIGEMERRMGRFKEAVKTWTDLARKYPNDQSAQNALYSAGYLTENELKNKNEAVKLYKKYIELNPKDVNKKKNAEERLKELTK